MSGKKILLLVPFLKECHVSLLNISSLFAKTIKCNDHMQTSQLKNAEAKILNRYANVDANVILQRCK